MELAVILIIPLGVSILHARFIFVAKKFKEVLNNPFSMDIKDAEIKQQEGKCDKN